MGCAAANVPYGDGSATQHICTDPTYFIQHYLIPYLKVGRYCSSINASNGCPEFKYKTLNGKGPYSFGPSSEYPMIYLVDGTRIAVMIFNLWYTETSTGNTIVSYKRAQLWVDTTGLAGPNTGGKDVLIFIL
jgi:hypothetical protein